MPQQIDNIDRLSINQDSRVNYNRSMMDTNDHYLTKKSKYPLDFEIHGNPYTLINQQGISNG